MGKGTPETQNGRWSPPRDGPLSVRKIFLLNVERRI
nr:MAG TPA: hypothetical protein [Caudoviricetes sp.]